MPKFHTSEDRQRQERLSNDIVKTDVKEALLEDDTKHGYVWGKPKKSKKKSKGMKSKK